MRTLFWASILLGQLTGCALFGGGGAATPTAEEAQTVPSTVYALGEGDVVEIKVFREPDFTGVYRISEAGTIDFPLIGKVNVDGRTASKVAEEIRTRLAAGYLKQPQVTVFVRETKSQKIHVLGEVNKPGTFVYEAGMTVIQAVTDAGGFARLASPNSVRITRSGIDRKFVVRVGDIRNGNAPNFKLQPGDIVFVPEAMF